MSAIVAKPTHSSRRGWLLAGAAFVVAGGLAGYGIWSRQSAVTQLGQTTQADALPQVQVINPKPGPVHRTVTLPGNIAAWYQASIYGQVTGYVQHWYKDYGASVKSGEVLGTISTPSLDAELAAAKAQLGAAQARYNLAALTAQRWSALSGTQAVAKQDVDIKKADAAVQKAELTAAQQNVQKFEAMAGFKTLVAPFDGVVTARNLNIGDFVSANGGNQTAQAPSQPLFVVADIHKLRVFVSVPQTFSDLLQPGLTAEITLPQQPGQKIPVQFLTTARAVSTDTRTVVTEFQLDNPNGDLWPGTFVSLSATFPGNPDLLVLPAQAVLFRAQGAQVALVGTDGTVHLQDIQVGHNLGTTVQIVSGVKQGDRVVANPSQGLLDGERVQVVQPSAGGTPGADDAAQPTKGGNTGSANKS